jgi:hypothetical protein
MSTENPPAEPTDPSAPAPKGRPVKPNNQYQDIIGEVPADGASSPVEEKTTKPGTAEPDNQYQDSAPKG